jgi:6-phosphogluconate dehydrogenase
MSKSSIGIYGMGVMGQNLALNLEEHGHQVSLFNRKVEGEESVVTDFMSNYGRDKNFLPAESVKMLVTTLEKPRKILIMVKAGEAVDSVIEVLLPFLDKDDILIDGGNSHFEDTERRLKDLRSNKIQFVGMGISGGADGARNGPSLMPGSTKKAWSKLSEIFEPIAAKSFSGTPCCELLGPGGSGHFVKMVHNGIEYAEMQLIAEVYQILRQGCGMSAYQISEQFRRWSDGPMGSYLNEITADILTITDDEGRPLLDSIDDSAGQKGTGKWISLHALQSGIPLATTTQSVFSRFTSTYREIRRSTSFSVDGPVPAGNLDSNTILPLVSEAILASRMVIHAEAFFLITQTSAERKWDIDPAIVARIWQGGCIIRSELLRNIVAAYEQGSNLTNLLQSPIFANRFRKVQDGWRKTAGIAISAGIPVPVLTAALAQYDSLRTVTLPSTLIQAQRDYFGSHGYLRTDDPSGKLHHTEWKNAVSEEENKDTSGFFDVVED